MIKKGFYALLILVVIYFISVNLAGLYLYFNVLKGEHKSTHINLYTSHYELGWALRKNVQGFGIDNLGRTIPYYTDNWGRINEADFINGEAEITFIGDSYIQGTDTAKNAFPFIYSSLTGKKILNAGLAGVNFAQMLIICDSVLKYKKPKILVVQFSPLSLANALKKELNIGGLVTLNVPYLYCNDGLKIFPATHPLSLIDMKDSPEFNEYRNTPSSFSEWFRYNFVFWIPAINNYVKQKTFRLLANNPAPCRFNNINVEDILVKFKNRCDKYNIELMLIQTEYDYSDDINIEKATELKKWATQQNITYFDLDSMLWSLLPVMDRTVFDTTYRHTTGNPPVVLDHHLNYMANKLIANRLIDILDCD